MDSFTSSWAWKQSTHCDNSSSGAVFLSDMFADCLLEPAKWIPEFQIEVRKFVLSFLTKLAIPPPTCSFKIVIQVGTCLPYFRLETLRKSGTKISGICVKVSSEWIWVAIFPVRCSLAYVQFTSSNLSYLNFYHKLFGLLTPQCSMYLRNYMISIKVESKLSGKDCCKSWVYTSSLM